jgi:hypothetical protein
MLVEAYRQFAREERRSQPPALRWVGWRWLVCGTATILLLCWFANALLLELHRRHSQLEHARGIVEQGGWFR